MLEEKQEQVLCTFGKKGAISSDEDCTEISWTHHTLTQTHCP
jgi:hypothetical protein